MANDKDFSDFVQAVQDSAPEDGTVRETRHTSSVGTSDWQRVEEARSAQDRDQK